MVLVVQITKDGNGRLNRPQTEAIKEKLYQFLLDLVADFPARLRTRSRDLTGKIRIS